MEAVNATSEVCWLSFLWFVGSCGSLVAVTGAWLNLSSTAQGKVPMAFLAQGPGIDGHEAKWVEQQWSMCRTDRQQCRLGTLQAFLWSPISKPLPFLSPEHGSLSSLNVCNSQLVPGQAVLLTPALLP